MTQIEIENLLKKPEVIEYLKNNIELLLSVEPCENILGYDITATVSLFGHTIAEDTDCI